MTKIIRILVLTLVVAGLAGCAATLDQARDQESCEQAADASCVSAGCVNGDETWETMVRDCMEQKGYFY